MQLTPFEAIQGAVLSNYAGLVRRTARLQVTGHEHLEQANESGRPSIIAAWHGMTMMMAAYLCTYFDPARHVLIVPDDTRGAVLNVWARHIGANAFAISMDDNSMVAGRRLLALIRQLKQGQRLFVNPDGPDGPTHEPKPGIAFIARKARALIVPAGAFTATAYHIPRWDRYAVPFPFSRIAIAVGEPFEVTAGAEPQAALDTIRARLNEAEQAAQALYRRNHELNEHGTNHAKQS